MIRVSDSKIARVHVLNVKAARGGAMTIEAGFLSEEPGGGVAPKGKVPLIISTEDPRVADAVKELFEKLDEVAGNAFFNSVGKQTKERSKFTF